MTFPIRAIHTKLFQIYKYAQAEDFEAAHREEIRLWEFCLGQIASGHHDKAHCVVMANEVLRSKAIEFKRVTS